MSAGSIMMEEDLKDCPLCMELLEVDDLSFFPCTCLYQICRFCWHRLRTDGNGLCPACRKSYPEYPADFTPLSKEQITALKAEKKYQDQLRKQKILDNRKHLENVRVVQKNLVFVVGLPMKLADADILKKYEYFGKFGKITKIVINQSTSYAGSQTPSASAFVTYSQNNDALRAIQAVNNVCIDGRVLKTSLGTTKYCSYFMKNMPCPKQDCMYLHKMDREATFTKEDMNQGKHQEYEKKLHDTFIQQFNKPENLVMPLKAPMSSRLVTLGRSSAWSGHATSSSSKTKSKDVKSARVPKELKMENINSNKKINKNDCYLSSATNLQNLSISKTQNAGDRRNLFGQSVGSGDSSTGVSHSEALPETKYQNGQNLSYYTGVYNSSSAGDGRLSQQISQESYPNEEGMVRSSFMNMPSNSQMRTVFKENPNIYTQKMSLYPSERRPSNFDILAGQTEASYSPATPFHEPGAHSSFYQAPIGGKMKTIQPKNSISKIPQMKTSMNYNKTFASKPSTPHTLSHRQLEDLEIYHTKLVNEELGFDPFEETQKGLAELMRKEKINQNKKSQTEGIVTKACKPPPGFNHINIGMSKTGSTLNNHSGAHYQRRHEANNIDNSEVILKKYSKKPEHNSFINIPIGCMRIPGTQFLLQTDPGITASFENYNNNTHYITQPILHNTWTNNNDEHIITNNLLLNGIPPDITVEGNQQLQEFQNTDIPLLLNNTKSESNN